MGKKINDCYHVCCKTNGSRKKIQLKYVKLIRRAMLNLIGILMKQIKDITCIKNNETDSFNLSVACFFVHTNVQ